MSCWHAGVRAMVSRTQTASLARTQERRHCQRQWFRVSQDNNSPCSLTISHTALAAARATSKASRVRMASKRGLVNVTQSVRKLQCLL